MRIVFDFVTYRFLLIFLCHYKIKHFISRAIAERKEVREGGRKGMIKK